MDKLGGNAATEIMLTQSSIDVTLLSYTLIFIAGLMVVFVGYILIHLSEVNKRYRITEFKRSDDSELIKLSYRLILKITTSFDKITFIVAIMFVSTLTLWIVLMVVDFGSKGR